MTAQIIEAKLATLTAKIKAHHRNVNEGDMDMSTQWDAEHAALRAELAAARKADYDAEWSAENTAARKVEFNAEIAKIAAKRKPVWADIAAIQDKVGYRYDDLKAAVARHAV